MNPALAHDDAPQILPIDEGVVELRVDVELHWPAELEGDDSVSGWTVRQAHEAARDLFASYRAGRRLHANDGRLTPEGALEADAEWVRKNLPNLDKHAVSLRETRATMEKNLERLLSELAERPDDPAEIAELQEIRTYFRSLPADERTSRLEALVAKGDTTALRAVLTGPSYLTGVDEEIVALLREEAARKANPERFARIEAVKKAAVAAEQAIDGVRRFLTHDCTPEGARDRPDFVGAGSRPSGLRIPPGPAARVGRAPILRAPDHRRSGVE